MTLQSILKGAKKQPELTFEDKVRRIGEVTHLANQIAVQREQELDVIRKKYAPMIKPHLDELEDLKQQVETEAKKKRKDEDDEYFKAKKSIKIGMVEIGFKTNPPKLVAVDGKKWPEILKLAKQYYKKYVRNKPELDKSALLKLRDDEKSKEVYDKLCVKVEQDENFFVKVDPTAGL